MSNDKIPEDKTTIVPKAIRDKISGSKSVNAELLYQLGVKDERVRRGEPSYENEGTINIPSGEKTMDPTATRKRQHSHFFEFYGPEGSDGVNVQGAGMNTSSGN